jgi:RNA polymerase sigma-70 factor (ECF subfamily)
MDFQKVKCLIELSIQGDKASFRSLVESHQPFAYAVAFRLLNNDFETEEVVQEAFIRVWKNLTKYDNNMRFTTWLYKIVVNLCYDRIRYFKTTKNLRNVNISGSVLVNMASDSNIEQELINREQADIIKFLTDSLTPHQKLVFVLSELEGLSPGEINEITGLSANKIKSNLYCARQVIKEKLIRIEERIGNYAI